MMKKEGHPFVLGVTDHGAKSLKRGTLRSIIKDAGLTVGEFVALLR